jgi:hypothetical protein
MTLAAIFLVSILGTALPWITASYQSAPPAWSANQTSNAAETQSQEAPPPAQTPNTSQTPAAAPSGKTSSGANAHTTTKRHKKKVVPSNCNSAPRAAGQGAAGSSSPNPAPSDPAPAGNAPTSPATSSVPTNCPPSKVIVKQGGTADPSIQLAGGAGSKQTSQERDTAKQMLGTTEANLKQIAGRQLTSNQEDMVTQIKQFMEQSKAAVADGDLDRARTLAWKAQVLSEELVKPSQ